VLTLLGAALAGPALGGCDQIASLVVSDEDVERLGLQAWAALASEKPVSGNTAARRVARDVSARLLEVAGERPGDWEVEVFADPTANAFVLPGRKIGIFEGMLGPARDEGGLAAVIGHEIGHLEAGHPGERITGEIARQIGVQAIAYVLEINDVAFSREIAGLLGIGAEFGLVRPYGRRQELEADRLGLFMMAEAGFDPRDAAALWQRMAALDTGGPPALLSTHPAPENRIEAIEALIPQAVEAARRSR
jgi:predicted Zn-dependent protease